MTEDRSDRIVVVGEGMLELIGAGDTCRLGFGGDTLNTAIHLARMNLPTAYFTALGADPFSEDLRRAWAAEGLDVSMILTDRGRLPGLYAIRTDQRGERSFFYWREHAAVKRMFELPDAAEAIEKAAQARVLIFSLISLAVLTTDGRELLLELAAQVRASGGIVAFDGNYRAALWPDTELACRVRDRAISHCSIGLPTLTDEHALSGEADAQAVAEHWRTCGADEVVVKLGERGCFLGGKTIAPPSSIDPVDTSGAGDAFNAGYLASRIQGRNPEEAALAGHALAAWVIRRPGAIPPRDSGAPYRK